MMKMAPRSDAAPFSWPLPACGRGSHFPLLLPLPEILVLRRRLVLQQGAEHLNGFLSGGKYGPAGQIERRIFRVCAGDRLQPALSETKDQPADADPVDRAGAHGA